MRSINFLTIAALAAVAAACGNRSPVAYGEPSSIIVVAPDSLWASVRDTVHTVMEPEVFTVRGERTFELTHISPEDPDWAKLREWKQVLVIGRADDPWVSPALAGREPSSPLPALVERNDIWARGQTVTAVVVPDERMAEKVIEILPRVHEAYDRRFRRDALQRMYVSGADTALQDTLRREAGFSLLVPSVYDWTRLDDSAYRFLNANRNAGALDRSVLVTWRPGTGAITPESLLAWRDSVGAELYEWGQAVNREEIRKRPVEGFGEGAIEIRGVWLGTDPTFPMAGPFLARALACPAQDRTYLIDAWLYAPSRNKYEYVLQLETILDSFDCGS